MPMWSSVAFMFWFAPGLNYRGRSSDRPACLQTRPLQQAARRGVGIDLARGDVIDDRVQLTRREHLTLEVIHEALRDQLAQAVLAALVPPRRLSGGGGLTEAPDRLDGLRLALPAGRCRDPDRRPPLAGSVRMQREVRLDRADQAIRTLAIRLVDHEDVGDFHDPGLERLHFVAGAGHERDDRDVRRANDIHFVLPDTDRFDDDEILASRVE